VNIVEPILYQCKLNPYATAIATPGSGINAIKYGQLAELIHNVARAAIKAGLAPGDVAAVLVSDAILHAVLTLGLMRIGIATMSIGEPSLPEHVKVDAILTDNPRAFPDAGNVITVNATWLQGEGAAPDYNRIYRTNRDDDCRIILTSGSTGRRKGVAFSHAVMLERVQNPHATGGRFARVLRLYSGFGIASTPGFRLALYILMKGGTLYYEGRDPDTILQFLGAHQIQGYCASPQQLSGLLKRFEDDPTLDSSLEVIVCGGATLPPALAARARRRLCPYIYTSYGSTETTTVAHGPSQLADRTPGAVGYVCPGVTVDILDHEGRLLPVGREGIIRVRSPQVAGGYVGDPEATAQTFRDGGFYTGDLGFVTAEGVLAISGRTKTALSLGGDTVAPEVVEEALCNATGIEQVAVCAIDDDMGISVIHAVVVAREDVDNAALRAQCQNRMSPVHIPVQFHKVDAIPRVGLDKIDRPRVLEIVKSRVKSP